MTTAAPEAAPITSIPTIDLSCFATGLPLPSPAAAAVAATIDRTCREIGFLLVVGHGVRPETKANLLAKMREFFALPLAEKERIAIDKSDCHRGFIALGEENLEGALSEHEVTGAYGMGDLKEGLDTGIDAGPDHPEVIAGTPLHGPNQLPDLPGFEEAWATYFAEVTEASLRVQRGLAMALDLAPTYFEDFPGDPMLHLRMLHYPPAAKLDMSGGQYGCGEHTDYGTITVLADDGVGGLQVQLRGGQWIDAAVPPDHLVVNLGDLITIWTNDRWVSNPHRVVNPPNTDRYSIPLFVEPPFHTVIEPLPTCIAPGETPRHESVVTGPYLLSRFDGTHSYRNPLV